MPALKMKTKSIEENALSVCSKSSVISKNSCSQVRISQQAVNLEFSIQKDQDVSSNIEVSARENECDAAVDHQEFFDGETCQFQKPTSSSVDFPYVGRMEFLPATCASNLETIFSPIFEFIEVHCEPNIYNYAVGNVTHLKADDNNDGRRVSCDSQTCNVSDFYISDMAVVDEIIEANLFPDYECIDHDMTEGDMMLPFLEENIEISNTQDAELYEAVMNSDDACLHLAIQQIKSCDLEPELSPLSFNPYEADCFDPHLFIRNLPDPSDVVPTLWPSLVPKETWKRKSITLVLDLDETLVHSTLDHVVEADFTFPVFFNMKEHIVYVKQRPYLQTFLESVAEMFEIIIFTASQSTYAEQLLNILDPERKFFSQRAYRESCIFSDGSYIKDLTVLGLDLAKVAIIDNTPQVFRLQVNNGIPIKSWYDDPSDCALISLLPFLETLVDVDDVRPIIAQRYSKK